MAVSKNGNSLVIRFICILDLRFETILLQLQFSLYMQFKILLILFDDHGTKSLLTCCFFLFMTASFS